MAFTNGEAPRIIGTVSGMPVRVENDLVVNPTTTAVGDLVTLTSGAWAVYAANGTALGGIYLGRDPGYIASGGVAIPTPGLNAEGPGVFHADGLNGNAATVLKGAVAIITKDTLVEIDIVEGETMTAYVPGFTGVELCGATRVSASSGGFYLQLNASSGTDSACQIVEVLRNPTATTHGRAVVRFDQSAITLTPGA